jgi:hypothetical protein
MARRTRDAIDYDEEDTGTSLLSRALMWGGLAVVALGGAALSGQSETGAQRLAALVQGAPAPAATRPATPAAPAPRPVESDEAKRLAESVRLLAADRDRLLARLDALERNLDVTGSTHQDNPAPAAQPPATPMNAPLPPGWSMVPSTIPPAAGIPSATFPPQGTAGTSGAPSHPAAPASPQQADRAGELTANDQAAESSVTKTEFGVDVGGNHTLNGLRAMWSSIKGRHGALLDGLRPLVAVREGKKPGAVELRLVAGPLANAVAAARLCASLSAAGVTCQPTIFDGQRLALR